jgi:heme o synthase
MDAGWVEGPAGRERLGDAGTSAAPWTSASLGVAAFVRLLASLVKLPSTLAVTLTAAAGFLLYAGRPAQGLLAVVAGTLLTVAAASALNQVQDSDLDARMRRTAGRPIPTGRLGRRTALGIVALLALAGFAVLAMVPSQPRVATGLAALSFAWYNGVYTPLKRVTPFAAIPGAVVGAIPPAIGWVAAGGSIADPRIWGVAAYFFLWQVPHVGLIVQRNTEDWRRARLPLLSARLAPGPLAAATFAGVLATAVAAPLAAVLLDLSSARILAIGIASALLALTGTGLFAAPAGDRVLRRLFLVLNAHALGFTLILIAASLP